MERFGSWMWTRYYWFKEKSWKAYGFQQLWDLQRRKTMGIQSLPRIFNFLVSDIVLCTIRSFSYSWKLPLGNIDIINIDCIKEYDKLIFKPIFQFNLINTLNSITSKTIKMSKVEECVLRNLLNRCLRNSGCFLTKKRGSNLDNIAATNDKYFSSPFVNQFLVCLSFCFDATVKIICCRLLFVFW